MKDSTVYKYAYVSLPSNFVRYGHLSLCLFSTNLESRTLAPNFHCLSSKCFTFLLWPFHSLSPTYSTETEPKSKFTSVSEISSSSPPFLYFYSGLCDPSAVAGLSAGTCVTLLQELMFQAAPCGCPAIERGDLPAVMGTPGSWRGQCCSEGAKSSLWRPFRKTVTKLKSHWWPRNLWSCTCRGELGYLNRYQYYKF